jgi:hypothetical protein
MCLQLHFQFSVPETILYEYCREWKYSWLQLSFTVNFSLKYFEGMCRVYEDWPCMMKRISWFGPISPAEFIRTYHPQSGEAQYA